MKKKNWIITVLAATGAACFFLFIGFSSHASAQKDKSTCCSQKISTGPGGKKCNTGGYVSGQGEMILDNLSRQFLFISPSGY